MTLKTSVLLGRIITFHNEVHPCLDRARQDLRFQELENGLTRLCLVAPPVTHFSTEVPSPYLHVSIWLQFLLHTCTILLYHPVADTGTLEVPATFPHRSEQSLGFSRCVNATQCVLRTIKMIASVSVQPLTSPFLMPTYFLCSRFLAIGWLETGNQALRNDIDLILLILDRVGETHAGLANKYRTSILADLARTPAEAREMRVGTGSYLGNGCYNSKDETRRLCN